MIYNETSLNKNWDLCTLTELAKFSRGKSKHRPRNDIKLFENGDIPLIQTGDIKNANIYLEEATEFYNAFGLKQSKLWDEGTLCITIAANIAETAILKTKMCFPDSVVGVTPYEGKSTSKYLHYLFAFIRYRIQNSIQGSIQDNINIEYLSSLKFRVPQFSIQQKIATVLSALDDKIELNNKINAELEAMAKTLYNYWFVQFDFPNEEGKPYKSSGGEMEYNAVLKREIPKGWEVKRFGESFEISRGTLITKETSTEGNYKVVAAGLNYSYLTGTFNRNEFTITVSGSGANAGYINFWTEKIFASDCTTVRGNTDSETFVALQFLKLFQDYIFSLAKGSAQPHVYPSDIEGLNYISIPDILVEKYGTLANNIYTKISINQEQNQELAQLRDWLLPMLMNGQVTVGEFEKLQMVAEEVVSYKNVEKDI